MFNLLHLLCFCLLGVFSCASEKIVIDTDAGGDDALAILMLLRAESLRKSLGNHFEIVAITCTYGNTLEENVEVNVLKILTIANRIDIPVYVGAKKPMLKDFRSDNFFGADGFGDFDFRLNITKEVNKSIESSEVLLQLSKTYDGNLTIIVLGPTTNVALAMQADQNFAKRVKTFYVSGSSIAGMGNVGTNIEFNFAADPESDDIFLRSVNSSQLTLFPWETGLNIGLPRDWRIRVLGTIESPYRAFINNVERISLSKTTLYVPSDVLTVASFLAPGIITFSLPTHIQVTLSGEARGATTVKYIALDSSNAQLILAVDREKLELTLLSCLTFNYYRC